jgi:hypothetical protein
MLTVQETISWDPSRLHSTCNLSNSLIYLIDIVVPDLALSKITT